MTRDRLALDAPPRVLFGTAVGRRDGDHGVHPRTPAPNHAVGYAVIAFFAKCRTMATMPMSPMDLPIDSS